jgi:hypothetical protein
LKKGGKISKQPEKAVKTPDPDIEVIESDDYKKKNPEKNYISEGGLERLVSMERKADLVLQKELEGLGETYQILLLADSKIYSEVRQAAIRRLSGTEGIYVTLNSPYVAFRKVKGIDYRKVHFIDLISKMTDSKMPATKSVSYLESATDLTELVLLLEKKLKGFSKGAFIIVDSVSTMLVYNNAREVEKLIHVLVRRAEASGARLVLLMVKSKEHEGIIETVGQFCTKIVSIEKFGI